MYYIRRSVSGLEVKTHSETKIIKKGIKQFLNDLLIDEQTTFEGRRLALKKKYGLKYNIPIYVHEACCFYTTKPLRDRDAVCINYHEVLSIRKTTANTAEIIFKDLYILPLDMPYKTIIRKHMDTGHFLTRIE